MYYKLNSNYALRGWMQMTCALIDLSAAKITFLEKKEFQVLLLCDGETSIEDLDLPSSYFDILSTYEEKHIIVKTEECTPISEEQIYYLYQNRYVNSVVWSVTGRCNYRCRHCYMDAPDGKYGELTTEEAFHMIDQMAECGIFKIDITGGEPFVRKDIWQLIDRLNSYHIKIRTIYTNGWLLTDHVLDEFEKRGIYPHFSISYDGMGWHDWMRGVQGAEKAALNALKRCQDRGFITDIEMCVHRGNIDTIMDTVEKVSSLGCKDIKVVNVSNTERWIGNAEGNQIDIEEVLNKYMEIIPEYFKDHRTEYLALAPAIILKPYFKEDRVYIKYGLYAEKCDGTEDACNCLLCDDARFDCYISPNGTMLPCMPMTASANLQSFPKITEVGLQKCLSDSYFMTFVTSKVKDLFERNKECAACSYRLQCGGGCRAEALLEDENNLWGADREQCLLFKKGYVKRIRETVEQSIRKYGADFSVT